MRSLNLSSTRPQRGLLPAVVLALFLMVALRPGPAAALGNTPPGLPPQVLDAGFSHSCALTATGAIDCWGDNFNGQGTGQTGPYSEVSVGGNHNCALTPAGAADCWGSDSFGEGTDQPGPYTQLSAGSYHTCGLTPAGAADCWGDNFSGKADDQPGPYTQLSAGNNHNCGLTPAGAADCWGSDSFGEGTDQPGPYIQVSAGGFHTCALTPAGAVDCWGGDSSGQATDMPGPYTQVSAGSYHTCALTTTGAADCWGNNSYGRADDQPGPYTQVSAGANHTCALTPTGAADCWGLDGSGQATDQAGPYRPYEPNEPNDSAGTATPLGYEEVVRNQFVGLAGDADYYTFYAFTGEQFVVGLEAASIGSDLDPVLTLYDTDGTTVLEINDDSNGLDSRLSFTLPAEGYYYLQVRDYDALTAGGPRYFYNLSIRPHSIYVSPTGKGTVGTVSATPQDILRYDSNTGIWSMWLDGSDVGITKALTAFARLPGGDWLLVFKANQTTPAGVFTPWDIARFTPSSMGETTAGTFSWHFDGSDVGLTTSGEKIDALDWTQQLITPNTLMISTSGTMKVPGPGGTLKAQDEDVVLFELLVTGANTIGDWVPFFDGTVVPGMKGEDLSALDWDYDTGVFHTGITGSFKIGGVSGSGKDILVLTPDAAPGGYSASKTSLPSLGFNLNVGGLEMD